MYQPEVAATMAEYIEYITPVPSAKQAIEAHAAAATNKDDKAALLQAAESPLIFPSADVLAKTSYYRVLTPSETTQWNDIFNAVITA